MVPSRGLVGCLCARSFRSGCGGGVGSSRNNIMRFFPQAARVLLKLSKKSQKKNSKVSNEKRDASRETNRASFFESLDRFFPCLIAALLQRASKCRGGEYNDICEGKILAQAGHAGNGEAPGRTTDGTDAALQRKWEWVTLLRGMRQRYQ